MSAPFLRMQGLGALALMALSACCSRSIPDVFPSTSAASPEGAEVAPVPVAAALREDPPLPGEDASRWEGLNPADASASNPHAHRHHPGMVMPETPTAPDAGAATPADPHAGHRHAP